MNPATVGAFVLGALALIIAAIAVFGSGRLFRSTQTYVVYFNSNVNGLRVGAPVKFRGVDIGSVKAILLSLNGVEMLLPSNGPSTVRIPVLIELDSKKIVSRGGANVDLNNPETMKRAIQNGLRAQLGLESLVTGMLYIDLDMHPKSKANFVLGPEAPYLEIPTMPTALERAQSSATRILEELDRIDFPALIDSLTGAAQSIHDLAGSPRLQTTLASLNKAANSLDAAALGIKQATDEIRAQVKPVGQDLRETTADLRHTLDQATQTLKSVQTTLQPGSPFTYQLDRTLADTSSAARSIKELADYLDRNPSALLTGRYEGKDYHR